MTDFTAKTTSPIVLFDGVCNLCEASVQFILKRDPRGIFRFASLQSTAGQEFLKRYSLPQEEFHSMILVEDGRIYNRSTAALRIAKRLKGPWPLLYAFIVLPKFLRDWVYDRIAKNRYRWFGKKEECMIPTPEMKERFLDGGGA